MLCRLQFWCPSVRTKSHNCNRSTQNVLNLSQPIAMLLIPCISLIAIWKNSHFCCCCVHVCLVKAIQNSAKTIRFIDISSVIPCSIWLLTMAWYAHLMFESPIRTCRYHTKKKKSGFFFFCISKLKFPLNWMNSRSSHWCNMSTTMTTKLQRIEFNWYINNVNDFEISSVRAIS